MGYIGVVFFFGFIISVLVQVISRTFLPRTPSWTEEAARYLFIFMVAFGSSAAVHQKEFVGLETVSNILGPTGLKVFMLVVNGSLLLFSAFVFQSSVLKFSLIKYRMVSTAMQIPMQYIYLSMLLFYGLLIFSFLLEIICIGLSLKTAKATEV
ncbi:MAG: TRAP transporter small permease subunit [Sphaerochaeta sp.]|nr:TRAP transporter small permease subunit [Sphaerochaeta sp.]